MVGNGPRSRGVETATQGQPQPECPSPSAARQPQTCAPQPPQPAGAKYQRGGDGTSRGPRRPPNHACCPCRDRRGPRALGGHRAGLGSGGRVRNAGRHGGLAGRGPPRAVSAPGAGPLPTGTNMTEAPVLPQRQGPAGPPPGRGAFLRSRGGQEGAGGPPVRTRSRQLELTGHLRAGRTGHPDVKTKTHTHSSREAAGAIEFWIKPKISVKFLLGTRPSQLHLPRPAHAPGLAPPWGTG